LDWDPETPLPQAQDVKWPGDRHGYSPGYIMLTFWR
jgi:hypothetical protein